MMSAIEPSFDQAEQVERDKGAEYRERLTRRAMLRQKIWRRIKIGIFATIFSIVLVGGAFASREIRDGMNAMAFHTTTDYRECKWQIGKMELTGRRSFTYPYMDLFGQRIIDTSRISEETTVNLPKDTTTIVGIKDENQWWGEQQAEGPAATIKLKPGKLYVVVSGKNFGAFDHESFCKQQPAKKEI